MPSSEKERSQKFQEKFQAVLSGLLKEDDNKYCADCDAKGPRWASWNLGIFVCIRCAGIHRNLGVHISRVKSVNLDQWTAEQIASMQAVGNAKGRLIYESNLPETFRRSQTDSAMEQFIRGKYEQKKWIAKEWTPESVVVSSELREDESFKEKRKSKNETVKINMENAFSSMKLDSKPKSSPKANSTLPNGKTPSKNNETTMTNKKQESSLLDLESSDVFATTQSATQQSENQLDLFNLGSATENNEASSNSLFQVDFLNNMNSNQVNTNETSLNLNTENMNNKSNETDLQDLLIGTSNQTTSTNKGQKAFDKNSILALYGQGANSQTNNLPGQTNNLPGQTNNFHGPSNNFPAPSNNMYSNNANLNSFNSNNLNNLLGQNFNPTINASNQQSPSMSNNFSQSFPMQQMNMFGKNQNDPKASNNQVNNSQDLFGDAFSNKNLFGANLNGNSTTANLKQEIPNIGNTLSLDLWQ